MQDFKKTITAAMKQIIAWLYGKKPMILPLMIIVTVITTYSLILPAFTLEQDKAKEQGGIDVPETQEELLQEEGKESADDGTSDGAQTITKETELTSKGKDYSVSVLVNKKADVPENTELQVSEIKERASGKAGEDKDPVAEDKDGRDYDELYKKAEKALKDKVGKTEIKRIRFYDISLMSGDTEVEPSSDVDVIIKSDSFKDAENHHILHFGKNGAEVIDSETKDGEISFKTDGFSVYAVVDDGSVVEESRMTLYFWHNDELIATMYVKNGDDTDAELEQIIYDPGIGETQTGELFKGWILDKPDYDTQDVANKMDIAEIRAWAKEMANADSIREGDEYNFYGMVFKTYSVTFKDEDNATIHSEALIFKASEGGVNYTINQPYTPKTQDEEFQGWYWTSPSGTGVTAEDGSVAPFPNSTKVRITDNVVFTVNVPKGYWLSFNENGRGASYTPPQFIPSLGDTVTQRPDNPTRLGYVFGGWYTNPECTGQQFTFGGKLTGRTTLYAKWTPVNQANYTVIIWQEKSSDTYADNVASGERKYDFVEAITLQGNVGSVINTVRRSTNNNQRVTDGDGTQYYNAQVNGTNISYTGYHCATFDTNVEITPEGTAILNVYYDRNIVTYTFHYPYGYTYTPITGIDNDNNPNKYGTNNGTDYFRVYWNNGAFRLTNNRMGAVYNGTIYTRSNNQSWQIYQDEIGLYGEKLNWPSDNSIWWYPSGNNGSASGTRMTYKNDFIPMDSNMNVNYYGLIGSGSNAISFYTQDLDNPNTYTLQYSVESNATTFNINDKFTGFHPSYYSSSNNGYWSDWIAVGSLNPSTGVYGTAVNINDGLRVLFDRIKNKIVFMDGSYFNGNGVRLDEENRGKLNETQEYYYEADLTSYNKGGSNYYTPTAPAGYAFGGWYADETCTQLYDFTTMPATGVTVYARWVQKQYRVFLHPDVPESDTSLEWAQTDQQMNFRITSGEKINGGSMIMGERSDYELIGWYLDEACTIPFNFEVYVLNDTTVTTPYDKTVDMTDEMNKYGNIVGTGYNSDITGDGGNDRFWIDTKLDLYAKWRSKLDGAPGINVIYDAVAGDTGTADTGHFADGSTTYEDPLTYYLDRAEATAAGASIANNLSQQFMYWVVQSWNESTQQYEDTQDIVYPGDTFEVLKAYAKVEELPPEQQTATVHNKYTVKLRAEYGDKDAPTPTHIWWFPNDETIDTRHSAIVEDNNLKINQAVPIETPEMREGYRFLGWARVDHIESGSTKEGEAMPTGKVLDLGYDDLFLTYHEANGSTNAYYTAVVNGAPRTVSQVAADEQDPYHDLYAVWEKAYKVTVKKIVEGTTEDQAIDFKFKAIKNIRDEIVQSDPFTLRHNGQKVVFNDVPKDSHFSVTETADEPFDFDITVTGKYKDDEGVDHVITGLSNGSDVTVQGDTEITVTNKRKTKKVKILKVDDTAPTPKALENATFTIDDNTLVTGADGYTSIVELDVSTTPYDLRETVAPHGYKGIDSSVPVSVAVSGVTVPPSAQNVSVSGPDTNGVYTITVVNELSTVPVRVVKVDQSGDPLEDAVFAFAQGSPTFGDTTSMTSKIPQGGTEAIIVEDEAVPLGTYTITETSAPDGYYPLEGDIVIKIEPVEGDVVVTAKIGGVDIPSSHIERDTDTGLWTVKIQNSAGVELPITGGEGTAMLYTMGLLLMLASGGALVIRRRLGRNK